MKTTTSERLKQLMKEQNIKQVDILEKSKFYQNKLGIKLNKSALSQFVNGRALPDQHKLTLLGATLGVSEVWLMGYDVPRTAPGMSSIEGNSNNYIVTNNKGFMGLDGGTNNSYTINNANENEAVKDNQDRSYCTQIADKAIQQEILDRFAEQLTLQQQQLAAQNKTIDLLEKILEKL